MNNICKTSIAVALGSFFAMSSYAKDVLVVWEDLNKAHSIDMAVADFEKNNDCKVVVREFNPVNLPYIICSLPSCFIVLFLNRYIQNLYCPVVNYIGKNSIFFYLTQGIGGSILFYIIPYMTFSNIYIKYILSLSINVVA